MDRLRGLLFLFCILFLIQGAVFQRLAPYYRGIGVNYAHEYNVVLKPSSHGSDPEIYVNNFVNRMQDSFRRSRTSGSLRVKDIYDKALCGCSAKITGTDALSMIRQQNEVAYIEDVLNVTTQCKSSTPSSSAQNEPSAPNNPNSVPEKWGLERIGERSLQLDGDKRALSYRDDGGKDVHIYIVDSGVRSSHSEFNGRFSNAGYDALGKGSHNSDCFGHGTHMAGIAAGRDYGVAPSATIHSVRVVDCAGKGTSDRLIKGLNWIANNFVHPAVVSISVTTKGYSYSVNNAVENLVKRGLVVSVLAGNGGIDACATSPASAPNAITVGATNHMDTRPRFSNFGSCVDIFAPGEDITSAWGNSDTSTKIDSGTSMACPHVSGAVAILWARNKNLNPKEVRSKLLNAATYGAVQNPGTNSKNWFLYIPPQ